MFKFRLDAVSDAVFGIVLTLIVIEIKVPHLKDGFSEYGLQKGLIALLPLVGAYFLSVMLVVSYWYTHNFLFSLMSKTLNRGLMNLNFLFLSLISLVPFASALLGEYPQSKTAVIIYSTLIATIALSAAYIRNYIFDNPNIDNANRIELNMDEKDLIYGTVRLYIGLFGSLIAVAVSFWSTYASIILLIIQALILLIPGAVRLFSKFTRLDQIKLHPKWQEYTEVKQKVKSTKK
jgi:uncharacterized membrane protein